MDTIKKIPKSAFDMEYSTQWRDEVDFLTKRGIYYTFRRKDETYGITTYKYTKTADLFVALADFYLRYKRDAKSQAKYKPKFEQQSFLNKDGSIKEEYIQPANERVILADGSIVHPIKPEEVVKVLQEEGVFTESKDDTE